MLLKFLQSARVCSSFRSDLTPLLCTPQLYTLMFHKKKLGYLGVRIKSPPPPTNRWNFWSLTKEGIYCAWQLLHSETRQKRFFEVGSEPGVAWGGDYLGVVGVIINDFYGYCFKGDPRVTTELFWPKAGFFWKFKVLQYVCVCAQNSFSGRYVKYCYFTA